MSLKTISPALKVAALDAGHKNGKQNQDSETQKRRQLNDCAAFSMRHDGLFWARPHSDAGLASGEIFVCAYFEIIGRVRAPDGTGWGRTIKFYDDDGVERTATVSDSELHSDFRALAARLAGLGLRIGYGRGKYLADFLSQSEPEARITHVNRTGWVTIRGQLCFVLPDRTVGEPPGERVILDGGAGPFELAGTLTEWKATVGAMAGNHVRAAFMVSASLAAPILHLSRFDGGGVHLFGSSSCGKSTLLEAAASVWGRGSLDNGFVRTWRATTNALEGTAAYHNDVALPLDELGLVDARDAAAAVYQLSGGQGKGRSRRDGTLRDSKTWRVMILSTGEMRLADKIVEGNGRAMAGQMVRLLDVPADAGKGVGVFDSVTETQTSKQLADDLRQAARRHYGTAGPAFIEAIIAEGPDEIGEMALEHLAAFRAAVLPPIADGQVQRAADRFGLIAAAGELAIALNILPWKSGTAKAAAEICFADWLDARGGTEPHEVAAAISQVRAFIELHGDARFKNLDEQSGRDVSNLAGYRRGRGVEAVWLVQPEVWKREVCAGFDPTAVARSLADRGMLVRATDSFARTTKIDGRPTRLYQLTAALVSEADNEG